METWIDFTISPSRWILILRLSRVRKKGNCKTNSTKVLSLVRFAFVKLQTLTGNENLPILYVLESSSAFLCTLEILLHGDWFVYMTINCIEVNGLSLLICNLLFCVLSGKSLTKVIDRYVIRIHDFVIVLYIF